MLSAVSRRGKGLTRESSLIQNRQTPNWDGGWMEVSRACGRLDGMGNAERRFNERVSAWEDGNPENCANNCSHSFEMACFMLGIF